MCTSGSTPHNISVYNVVLPDKPLNNFELSEAVKQLNIQNFRGVYCRDDLPKLPYRNEIGILNLDDSSGSGTHWVCWFKNLNTKFYFDSYGIDPPCELVQYLKRPIYCNTERIQPPDTVICGHLCLYVLKSLSELRSPSTYDYQKIINSLNV